MQKVGGGGDGVVPKKWVVVMVWCPIRRLPFRKHPVCEPPCANKGICVRPDECDCPDNFSGPRCGQQILPGLCERDPPSPENSKVYCSQRDCQVRCDDGYGVPPTGQQRLKLKCERGQWVPNDAPNFITIPDCVPVCFPACKNGGACLEENRCECPKDFRGDRCQYSVEECDMGKTDFNGEYECEDLEETRECQISCPLGVSFTFPPHPTYSCDYTEGFFTPESIPLCDHSDDGDCGYGLMKDVVSNKFTVLMTTTHDCENRSSSPCLESLTLKVEKDAFRLTLNGTSPSVKKNDASLSVPNHVDGLDFTWDGETLSLDASDLGLRLSIDSQGKVDARVDESRWKTISGLCGTLDGNRENDWVAEDGSHQDLQDFLQGWRDPGPSCEMENTSKSCDHLESAEKFCQRLLHHPAIKKCEQVIESNSFVEACIRDRCTCHESNKEACGCSTISIYMQRCRALDGLDDIDWRTPEFCPLKCEGNMGYTPCAPSREKTCLDQEDLVEEDKCREGCTCPKGTVLDQGRCIPLHQCPCRHHNATHGPGDVIQWDCNRCVCEGGKWECSGRACGARCAVVGDPHYDTFDGRKYDFMGKCSYTLLQSDQKFAISAQNVPCAGSVSQGLNYPVSLSKGMPSCIRSVKIQANEVTIDLLQNHLTLVNGREVRDFPVNVSGGHVIKYASNVFLLVTLSNGVEVWWDGETRVYIDAPAEFKGKTKGLCGTFNENQSDDFLTPEGDEEAEETMFANRWKTSESCPDSEQVQHPCERNPGRKPSAESICAVLKEPIFKACGGDVDPNPYYEDCIYDACNCESEMGSCACPVISSYGNECARRGVFLEWRHRVRECGMSCPVGQQYHVCGDSCSRTCLNLALHPDCESRCVEGCNCPKGLSMDAEGRCIPVADCPCLFGRKEYPPGFGQLRPGSRGIQLCKCLSGRWSCEPAAPNATTPAPPSSFKCDHWKHQQFTDCKPSPLPTCHSYMFSEEKKDLVVCEPGCVCEEGYVLDVDSGGKWECTKKECIGTCVSWGDSHLLTFDRKLYDFLGECSYAMAKGKLASDRTFELDIQNIPCGTSGVTCTKSLTLHAGGESVTLVRGKPLPPHTGKILVRDVGLLVLVEVRGIGLMVEWDRGTRVALHLDPQWKNKVKGLCGNFNGDEGDDFRGPAGGSPETEPAVFADAWRLQPHCPHTKTPPDPCMESPERKDWAWKKCSVLRSDVFRPCHSEVPFKPYLESNPMRRDQFQVLSVYECLSGTDMREQSSLRARQRLLFLFSLHRSGGRKVCRGEPCKFTYDTFPVIPETTTTAKTAPQTASCISGWSTWINNNHPVPFKNPDDVEPITFHWIDVNRYPESPICEIDEMAEIECRTVGTHVPPKLTGQDVECSLERGLVCRGTDAMQGRCHDYEIRIRCRCRHEGIGTTTSEPIGRREVEPLLTCKEGWTDWMDGSSPDESGEFETVGQLRRHYGFCPEQNMVDIECRPRENDTRRQGSCGLPIGLHCISPRDVKYAEGNPFPCADYEVRLKCDCGNCLDPLGMSSGDIQDSQISVSSFQSLDTMGNAARLGHPSRAWVPSTNHLGQEWIQVDFVGERNITGVVLEPHPELPYWVEAFSLETSVDGRNWLPFSVRPADDSGVFPGNVEGEGRREILFERMLTTRLLRLTPKRSHDWPAMRLEILGCRVKETGTTTTTSAPVPLILPVTFPPSPCIQSGWTSWISSHVPTPQDPDEAETVLMMRGKEAFCADEYVTDFQCRSRNASGKPLGFVCDLNMARPHKEDPDDCRAFLHCVPRLGYVEWVKKECNIGTLYHPVTMICDWPYNVYKLEVDALFLTVQPGAVNSLKACLVCQCAENEYSCDDTLCYATTPSGIPAVTCGWLDVDVSSIPPGADATSENDRWYILAAIEMPISKRSESEKLPEDCFHGHLEVYCLCPQETTGEPTTTSTGCDSWSEWINDNRPDDIMEWEMRTTDQLHSHGFCLQVSPVGLDRFGKDKHQRDKDMTIGRSQGKVEGLECGDVVTGETFNASRSDRIQCDLLTHPHLFCSGACHDFQIRYFCSCGGEGWIAGVENRDQYLQVDLGEQKAIHGMILVGKAGYVLAVHIQYSKDGSWFSFLSHSNGSPQVIPGPLAPHSKIRHLFKVPFEARYIRVNPLKWINHLELQVDLLGCPEDVVHMTTESSITTTLSGRYGGLYDSIRDEQVVHDRSVSFEGPKCEDAMGVKNGEIEDSMIVVSSSLRGNASLVRPGATMPWRPSTDSRTEYIQFDFLDPREVTGFQIYGDPVDKGNRVTSFKIKFSADGKLWNTVTDVSGQEEILGSKDERSIFLEKPLRTRYIRILPFTWEGQHIFMQIEVLGCYQPYLSFQFFVQNAQSQVSRILERCDCECIPCSKGTRLCRGSNICLNETRWCDGVEDCDEDERECKIATTTPESIPPRNGSCLIVEDEIKTFDEVKLEADFCHHVLARDSATTPPLWNISLEMVCEETDCWNAIHIEEDSYRVTFHSSKQIFYLGRRYHLEQIQRIGVLKGKFAVHQSGNVLFYESIRHGFKIWFRSGSLLHLHIQMSETQFGRVEGMCGFFNGDPSDERRTPKGSIAGSSSEFAKSWSLSQKSCTPHQCPSEVQSKATQICDTIMKTEAIKTCLSKLSSDEILRTCLKASCRCLRNTTQVEQCRCGYREYLAEKCLMKGEEIGPKESECDGARECGPNEEYKQECRGEGRCDPTCQMSGVIEVPSCGDTSGRCHLGCFCIPGTIRLQGKCIPREQCRNAVCEGFGDPWYFSFDRRPFSFNGNCTYTALKHEKFQVLVRNDNCGTDLTCLQVLTIVIGNHTTRLIPGKTLLGNEAVGEGVIKNDDFHLVSTWPGDEVSVFYPLLNAEITFQPRIKGFFIQLPSSLYGNSVQGLCGNMNGRADDDILTQNVSEFATRWQNWEMDGAAKQCAVGMEYRACAPKCIRTCKEIQDEMMSLFNQVIQVRLDMTQGSEEHCPFLQESEGCFCPPGTALWKPGTCVNESQCLPCDGHDHFFGDIWKPDPCTKCTCNEYGTQCEKEICPTPPVCLSGHRLKTESDQDHCCPRLTCRLFLSSVFTPIPKENGRIRTSFVAEPEKRSECPKLVEPDCGYGQELHLIESKDTCPSFACECVVKSNCPPLESPTLNEGEEGVLNEQGCCPRLEVICRKDKCPAESQCPPFHRKSIIPSTEKHCCPKFTCDPPKDGCVYEHQFSVDIQGFQHKLQNPLNAPKFYKVNTTWKDGLCRECRCIEKGAGKLTSECENIHCPNATDLFGDIYELIEELEPNACCPKFARVACKDDNNLPHPPGSSWKSKDPCLKYECIVREGKVERLEVRDRCQTNCSLGWVYKNETIERDKCCGRCVQVSCIDEAGGLRGMGEKWTSPDHCWNYICLPSPDEASVSLILFPVIPGSVRNSEDEPILQLVSKGEKIQCPLVDSGCPPEELYTDPTGCCQLCKHIGSSLRNCVKEYVNGSETQGLIRVQHPAKKGVLCKNPDPIPEMASCVGNCFSTATFDSVLGSYKRVCDCCQPERFKDTSVRLSCEDGSFITHALKLPSSCSCAPGC
ncbi:unnamed protein product [Darwinula stevensoni]|uniref:Hemocytin n=1 Tax=Darwinula stevensoni TaxID=69355 RepID=A0A7R8ZXT3_9CRUS|nr:unnamed protein product [Darwinula stevensoni]CAG0879041.1 unnamed protein product [Darwinula stevensoni]